MECVFNPQAYGETTLLRDRYMGTQHDTYPQEDAEAHFLDFDIGEAFYKTADNN